MLMMRHFSDKFRQLFAHCSDKNWLALNINTFLQYTGFQKLKCKNIPFCKQFAHFKETNGA